MAVSLAVSKAGENTETTENLFLSKFRYLFLFVLFFFFVIWS